MGSTTALRIARQYADMTVTDGTFALEPAMEPCGSRASASPGPALLGGPAGRGRGSGAIPEGGSAEI
ncbi:hypothetical protein GCM10027074_66580 [Streptomyces deserti]